MFDQDYDFREAMLAEARAEAAEQNPLKGYCKRIYFERTSRKRRKNHKKASHKPRRYRRNEVELLKFLPSGKCVQVKDLDTPGLDALAQEALAGTYIHPDENISQVFLDYFRKL